MSREIDLNYYKGWTRKAVTFTIDDGNVRMDRKLMSYVKPAGIWGTFNLCAHNVSQLPDAESYRRFYAGFEIANHVKYHPFCFADGAEMKISDEPFDPEKSDPDFLYKTNVPGLYQMHLPRGWRQIADADSYIKFADDGRKELEEIFGKGSVRSFVWPFGPQKNAKLFEHLKNSGYYGIRAVGATMDKTGFAVPENREAWSYNAGVGELRACTDLFKNYPEDGKLKFCCFGVHSVDYENAGKWDEVEYFCENFGNKPEEYFSAPVGEIFDYYDATKKVVVTDTSVYNPTPIDLYITIDGKRKILSAGETL